MTFNLTDRQVNSVQKIITIVENGTQTFQLSSLIFQRWKVRNLASIFDQNRLWEAFFSTLNKFLKYGHIFSADDRPMSTPKLMKFGEYAQFW